jgi:hypothetical protein
VISRRPDLALAATLLVAGLMTGGAVAADHPLPAKTDIPPDFSTTLCPSAEKAVQMLDHITVKAPPHDHITDTDDFFAGLAATGCAQDGTDRTEPVIITGVLGRKAVKLASGEERYIAYAGRGADGKPLFGVVDETGNDRAPRSPLEKWLDNQGAAGGMLTIAAPDEFGTRAYSCSTAAAAQMAVKAIAKDGSVSPESKEKAFMQAIQAAKCTPAQGRFQVRAILEERVMDCGHECEAVWTALEAADSNGLAIGLIYDASLM